MTSIKTVSALAAGVLALSAGVAAAQTPYGGSQGGQATQDDRVGAILGALFGDRFGGTSSLDAQWALGRRPLNTQRTQFSTRIDADVRSGALSSSSGNRLKSDYDALVQLETRYAADGRFTSQDRSDLNSRYAALTQALSEGGYGDNGSGSGSASVADGRAEFEGRVDAAVRARRLTRTEGTRLKADYQALIQVEAGYLRDGTISRREQDDLDTRLDALDARVGDGPSTGGPVVQDPRVRLTEIDRALSSNSVPRAEAAQIRVELGDLTRLEAAYARSSPSSDDRAYLERRIGELEVRARVQRR